MCRIDSDKTKLHKSTKIGHEFLIILQHIMNGFPGFL